ncbi:ester cyclase [Sphingomonas sp. BLCC-B65]|nr:ester cyclase [Sphingomonas sp. BLCC-B65]
MHIHDFARAATAAVNSHDPNAVVALWAEPAAYDSPLTGAQAGLDALRAREEALFAGFSDLTATITPLGQDGDTGAMLVRFDGTHDGAYGGFPPTGRTIALEMIAVVTFDNDGHVVGERVFIDSASVAGQLVG